MNDLIRRLRGVGRPWANDEAALCHEAAEAIETLLRSADYWKAEHLADIAEIEKLEPDARRYRWLRDRAASRLIRIAIENSGRVENGFATPLAVLKAATSDEAIDAAQQHS
jgi:hypothetical protein